MGMFRIPREKRLCYKDHERLESDQYHKETMHVNGSDVPVTRYADGTSTVHWGGPCGSTHYDEDGEEC